MRSYYVHFFTMKKNNKHKCFSSVLSSVCRLGLQCEYLKMACKCVVSLNKASLCLYVILSIFRPVNRLLKRSHTAVHLCMLNWHIRPPVRHLSQHEFIKLHVSYSLCCDTCTGSLCHQHLLLLWQTVYCVITWRLLKNWLNTAEAFLQYDSISSGVDSTRRAILCWMLWMYHMYCRKSYICISPI